MSLGHHNTREILRLAASIESQSEHPIASGIVREAEKRNLGLTTPRDFRVIPGKGAEAQVEGKSVKVVSPSYLKENNLPIEHEEVQKHTEGKTVVYILVDDQPEGALALADVIRPESHETVKRLKKMGLQVMMLTGDARIVAERVGRELDLDDFFPEVLPDQKAAKIREVKARGLTVAMVGDGVNDAPALVEADVGIAIGAGTDVAIESADIVLVRSNPQDVTSIIQLARATYSKMVQNDIPHINFGYEVRRPSCDE